MRTLRTRATVAAFCLIGSGAAWPQDTLLARNLAATCANCHGTDGRAVGEMKPLAGMPADEIVRKVGEFRSGVQPATIMHQISKGYTEEQIKLVAGYFAAQKARP